MYRGRITVLGIATLVNAMAATAQNLSFGADNFYRSESVQIQPITFPTQYHTNVTSNLFYPRNLSRSVETPAIVVGHPMGAVKEQSANLYATKLAEQGFVTISIDLPHWGGSDGEPRNAISAEYYAEAFSAAVDYLGLQGFVDRERIGGVGICGSGSFIISAAKIDTRLKAIATVSMYDMGAVTRNGLRKSQTLAQRKELINAAAAQRWNESEGAEPELIGGTVDRLEDATDAIQQEFYDFYRTTRGEVTPPGALPNTTTHPTRSSQVKFLNFYPFNDIDTIAPRPLLFVSGDQAHSREFSEEAHRLAAEPKELIWVPGAGHVDLYDRVELIPFDSLTRFFKQNL
ncbi:probable hydrolases of the alpha/beta superfamily [Fusarium torulosum]|uniref:Probable hydrolases of the alpha/beta superfamily n=1 Tax=Fusarium torulosum TaxID=33205 RepID=A0AAE8MDS6_9HYPO|nr:probable hydrolases of the alpha/beta superfamily [Fusarium torulosum]